ncbi:hypothetical protein IV203_009518 [Nitzschia inconspicua]|uniref:Uncharacterized protein n=1 Tax=Nitzschia inconspicua TaxID=303405 RepID=A0A9K3PK46_9STRA|nr:hypothetical protein IV203_009518 [Nitzschia inconspicua]
MKKDIVETVTVQQQQQHPVIIIRTTKYLWQSEEHCIAASHVESVNKQQQQPNIISTTFEFGNVSICEHC